jgi:hypothetical protein
MVRKCTFYLAMSLFPLTTLSTPAHGEIRETGISIEVWHLTAAGWVSPDDFLVIEIKRLSGPTYDMSESDPMSDTVQDRDTRVEQLPGDHECPTAFSDERWRRLPNVLALYGRLRKSGDCTGVFRF